MRAVAPADPARDSSDGSTSAPSPSPAQPPADVAELHRAGSGQPSGRRRARLGVVTAIIVLGVTVATIVAAWFARNEPAPMNTLRIIAVLPFKPLATSERDEAFEMGMTGSVITRLSRIPSLTVVPLASVRRFTALDQDPLEAGRALNADAVLEGHTHRTDDVVRIQTRLLRTEDGAALWAMEWDERGSGALDLERGSPNRSPTRYRCSWHLACANRFAARTPSASRHGNDTSSESTIWAFVKAHARARRRRRSVPPSGSIRSMPWRTPASRTP